MQGLFVCGARRFNRTFLVLKQARDALGVASSRVLIAPFWYWNAAKWYDCLEPWSVLIAPFWYWNKIVDTIWSKFVQSFNRTFLVLKRGHTGWPPGQRLRFNRTFLVLKHGNMSFAESSCSSFNRTFLVLKLNRMFMIFFTLMSFNRTFLVLKPCAPQWGSRGPDRF